MNLNLDWNVKVVELLTLIVVIFGGGIGFFWVERQQVELSSSQKILTEIQTQLVEINFKYADLNAAMESQNRHLSAQLSLADFVTDIQPSPTFSIANQLANTSENLYAIGFKIKNNGRFPVHADAPLVKLFSISADGTRTEIKNGKDFELTATIKFGMIQPQESVLSTIEFDLSNELERGKYILSVQIKAQLNWAVLRTAKKALAGYLNTEELDKLTKTERSYSVSFEKQN